MSVTCCPVGYVYIDANGNYNDPAIGIGTLVGIGGSDFSDTCVMVVSISNGYIAVGEPVEPIECLCCPIGTLYSSFRGICIGGGIAVKPVPCLDCVCPDPEPFECTPCEPEGLHTAFEFDFNSRQCEQCVVQDGGGPEGKIAYFLPVGFPDPITSGFKLKNKNFI